MQSRTKSHYQVSVPVVLIRLFVGCLSPAFAGSILAADFEELGRWPSAPWREPNDLHVQGDLAYLGTQAGLVILDISDPARPQYVSHLDCVAGGTTDIYAAADHVYLAAGNQALRLVNVTDPASPRLVAELGVGSRFVNAVYVFGDYAYLSHGTQGLGLARIQPPESPVYQLTHTPDAWGRIEIVGHLGYVSTLTGMQIMDFTDPRERVPKGSVDLGARAEGVAVRGDYAYLPMADGLHVIQVSDPDHPIESGVYSTSNDVGAVRIAGETAYLCVGTATQSTIQALDLGNPTQPSLLGEWPIKGGRPAMEVHLRHVLLLSSFAGVARMDIVDFTDPTAPAWVAAWENPGTVKQIRASADAVMAACDPGGFKVIDTTDPAAPRVSGSYTPPGGASVLCIGQVGTMVGLGGSDGFRVLALTDPAHPELKGTYVPMMGQVQRLELVGDRAYLVTGFGLGELEVLDLADPATPTRLGGATLMFDVMDLAVADNGLVMLATGWMDLQLFDTRQGADPTALPVYGGVPGVYAVEVRTQGEDLLAYLAGQNGLAIVQLNDPSHPQLVGQWEQSGINLRALALSGNRAYIANHQQLWAIDVTDPGSPSLIGDTSLGANGLGAMGDRVYALTGEGLVILQAGGSVPAPRLEYQLQAGALVLDWSNAGSGIWVLQHNSDLSDAQGWQAFPGSDQTTQWQPDLGAARQFFRLAPNPN